MPLEKITDGMGEESILTLNSAVVIATETPPNLL